MNTIAKALAAVNSNDPNKDTILAAAAPEMAKWIKDVTPYLETFLESASNVRDTCDDYDTLAPLVALVTEKPKLVSYTTGTAMGKFSLWEPAFDALSLAERDELNTVGYSGKNSAGQETTVEQYLNSLSKGVWSVHQIGFDTGDFSEKWVITHFEYK